MATKRSYQDACGAAHALDLVGERWALLVVRELVLGPKRFSDLKGDLPNISSNVLSHRLDELERAGVLSRHQLPPPAGAWVYELTDWGLELEPIISGLGRWGARSPTHRTDAPLNASGFILSLRTNFDPRLDDGITADFELRLGQDRFHARLIDGAFEVIRGTARHPTATIDSDPMTLASVIYGGRSLPDAINTGEATIEGDQAAAERFLALFTLPSKAPPPPS